MYLDEFLFLLYHIVNDFATVKMQKVVKIFINANKGGFSKNRDSSKFSFMALFSCKETNRSNT